MEKVHVVPEVLNTPYAQTGPTGPMRQKDKIVSLRLKSYHPPRKVVYTGRVTKVEPEIFQFDVTGLVPEPLPPPPAEPNPYINIFGDYTDAYWESRQMQVVSKRIPEFLEKVGVTSIANSAHGDRLAAEFEEYMEQVHPEECVIVGVLKGIYLDALQMWHDDHESQESEESDSYPSCVHVPLRDENGKELSQDIEPDPGHHPLYDDDGKEIKPASEDEYA